MSTHNQSELDLDFEAERAALRSKMGTIGAELKWLTRDRFEIKKSAQAWYKSVAPILIEEVKKYAQKLINEPFNGPEPIDASVARRWLEKWIAEDEKAQSERAN